MTELNNRLHESSSPYLLQHRNDPVHWQIWDSTALNIAKEQNKPILLSIGYAACHWCHVMAHESFSDPETAALMNKHFVNIKLDREERPDLDKIYQLAHQLLLQRPGGWPLTVFLTPDKHIPFFVGTYFPPESRNGLPAFSQILDRVSAYFTHEGDSITAQGEQIQTFFKSIDQRQFSEQVNPNPIKQAITTLKQEYDSQFGGFGNAPKFPFPGSLDFILKQWHKTAYSDEPDRDLLFMASHTLQRMAHGGINDQIGGGFYRYSVDQAWAIPHFEKMLYDNVQLLPLYTQMAQISGDAFYLEVANATVHCLQRDLLDQTEFSFYSALDADSENQAGQIQEGAYYLWSKQELEQSLELDEYYLAELAFNLSGEPNFSGQYHIHQVMGVAELAEQLQIPQAKIQIQLNTIKSKLRAKRELRKPPFRDYKKLTAWNALAVQSLAISARSQQDAGLTVLAEKVLESIHRHSLDRGLQVQLGIHSHPKAAFLDDYAYLLIAILEQLQNKWNTELLHWAIDLADTLIEQFSNQSGGFYFVAAHEQDQILYRPLSYTDDSLPSGNAMATLALLKLGHLVGDVRYLDIAEKTIKHCFDEISRAPQAHMTMLLALDEYLEPSNQVILRGESADIEFWKNTLHKIYAPKIQIYAIPNDVSNLPASLAAKNIQEISVAYICRGLSCKEPVNDLEKLIDALT